MTTSAEFRERARECIFWASRTDDAAHSSALTSIAREWTMAAFILDRQAARTGTERAARLLERAA